MTQAHPSPRLFSLASMAFSWPPRTHCNSGCKPWSIGTITSLWAMPVASAADSALLIDAQSSKSCAQALAVCQALGALQVFTGLLGSLLSNHTQSFTVNPPQRLEPLLTTSVSVTQVAYPSSLVSMTFHLPPLSRSSLLLAKGQKNPGFASVRPCSIHFCLELFSDRVLSWQQARVSPHGRAGFLLDLHRPSPVSKASLRFLQCARKTDCLGCQFLQNASPCTSVTCSPFLWKRLGKTLFPVSLHSAPH